MSTGRRTPTARHRALLPVLLVVLTGCAWWTPDPTVGEQDGDAVVRRLTRQRDHVEQRGSALLRLVREDWSGTVRRRTGHYEGCASTWLDEFRSYRYVLRARVDAGALRPRPASAVRSVARRAGFSSSRRGRGPDGGPQVAAESRGLRLVLTVVEGPVVGVHLAGPCVDVPPSQRDDWLVTEAPGGAGGAP